MTGTFESRTITVRIGRPADVVYNFASDPENFPKWASGLAKSLTKTNGEWVAETPQGPMTVRFTGQNRFGVLDHYVIPQSGPGIYIPMRVIANGDGSEVIFTLFRRPEMSAEKFLEDAAWVNRDLNALKDLLEA
ncbi:MAG TPA: hypothetical protein VNL14_14770 [Candidatus Acidoferrales bacterium]|nr:hypothetical protein [Candidatus Acidoferrales bacterium]